MGTEGIERWGGNFHETREMVMDEVETVFYFKQKPAYEMLRSDWSSDVCSPICDDISFEPADFTKIDELHEVNIQNARSEERRVGKECRSRWSQYH